ncbi:MAG: hypothetical protein U0586_01195 [Candidatus Brocadiaceae bacterium]
MRLKLVLFVAVLSAMSNVKILPAQDFELRELPITVSVVPVKDLSKLTIDKSQADMLVQQVAGESSFFRSQPAVNKVSKLKRIKELPIIVTDSNDEIVEIGSFKGKVWGIENFTTFSRYLVAINPKTGQILKYFDCPGISSTKYVGLGVSEKDLWLTNSYDKAIYRVNQKSGKIKKMYQLVDIGNQIINGGDIDKDGNFWFGQWDYYGVLGGCKLFKFNPATKKITQVMQISNTRWIYDVAFDKKGYAYVTISALTSDIKLKHFIFKLDLIKLKVVAKYERNPLESTLTFLDNKLMTADYYYWTRKYFFYKAPE